MPYGDNDPYITPKEARQATRKWIPTGVLGLILVLVAILAVVFGIIFIIKLVQPAANSIDNANQRHQAQVKQIQASAYNGNIGVQQSYIQQALTDVKAATAAGVSAASATYDAGDACYQISMIQITKPPVLTTFEAQNCVNGALSPDSKFNQP